MTLNVTALLEEIKNGRRTSIIPVLNDTGLRIGELCPVTVDTPDDAALMEAMTRWRQRFTRFFLTQFEGSPTLTRRYLSDIVLKNEDRILFILSDEAGRRVGHMGLANIGGGAAELDNFLRGESGGDANLVLHAERALLSWANRDLKVTRFTAKVLSFNWLVLDLHKEIGFHEVERLPLFKTVRDGVTEHHVITNGQANVSYTYVSMQMVAGDLQISRPFKIG